MGRELKRVPLDFDWPLKKTWEGFLMPETLEPSRCPICRGSGLNAETQALQNAYYDHDTPGQPYRWANKLTQEEVDQLAKDGRLRSFTHTWDIERGWVDKVPLREITAAEVNAKNHGLDAIGVWAAVEVRAKRLGVYGHCRVCDGEGYLYNDAQHKERYENWQGTEPPEGPGYQMWETTSEGSPISPVFETPELLARWLADANASAFGGQTATYEQWLSMIGKEWAPSMVLSSAGLQSGVEAS